MEYFEKKITYLRGLCDGSGFDPESKEGKIFHGMMDILEDMAFMLETFLDDEELEERKKTMPIKVKKDVKGYLKRYAQMVSSADKGAIINK